MNTVYFDCFNGAGGDMIVAALLDAGADETAVRSAVAALGLAGFTLSVDRVRRQGFAARRFRVDLDGTTSQPHRHLADVIGILDASRLADAVKAQAVEVFTRLARAEAAVHGVGIEAVHFHEVGAVDAIVDVVGAVAALASLRADRVLCSPVPLGSGTVDCDHGVMPVPAPATAELLRGVPTAASTETGELITPTAAAILTTMAGRFGSLPAMTLRSVGYGAGSREGGRVLNLLRVLVGESAAEGESDVVTVLETNLDDATPEIIGHCLHRLLAAGALDAYAVPIHMKKWRPATLLAVLCPPDRADALQTILFSETTTFGIRRQEVTRVKLVRRHAVVETPYGRLRIKIGERDAVRTASPEYEDCRAAAEAHGAALRDVIAAAEAAWARQQSQ